MCEYASENLSNKLYPVHEVFFPIALFAANFPRAGERLYALFDLAETHAVTGGPTPAQFTTVYYPALVGRQAKGKGALAPPKGSKSLMFLAADGSGTSVTWKKGTRGEKCCAAAHHCTVVCLFGCIPSSAHRRKRLCRSRLVCPVRICPSLHACSRHR